MARQTRLAAWVSCAVTLFLVAVTLVLDALTPGESLPDDLRPGPTWFVTPAYLLVLTGIGALIAARRPGNFIGWLMCAAAVLGALVELGHAYSEFSLAGNHPGLAGVEWLAWLATWISLPWLMLQMVYLPVLFPDGKVPSRRWAWLLWTASITALVGIAGRALDPGLLAAVQLRNPLGVPDPQGYLQKLAGVTTVVLIVLALASLASVFVRLEAATGDRRQQLKWFGSAITVLVIVVTAGMLSEAVFGTSVSPWLEALISLAYLTIPISIGFSLLRYRLYDIDLVISRTLVYTTLATFISAVYLVAVVGVGALVGFGNHVNLMLSWLAAGVVALAFQPVRERLQRLANRLVYGRRATPYDALAVLSRRVAETAPSELLLNDAAGAVCEAIGVPSASFWLRGGQEWRVVAQWPPDGRHEFPLLAPHGGPGLRAFPVHHQGSLLGAISVAVPPGRTLSPADERLLADVANQAGLVFRNLGLTADLMARLGELWDSRRRLVKAQDEERRRLERNLHDGAQQDLFGLKVNIRHVRTLLRRDPQGAEAALEQLEEEAEQALQTVRELARGVYPPLLTAHGLAGALGARARAAPVDVRISTDGAGRYPADLEEAVYFCCTEALQNAVRHAQASTVKISLAQEEGELVFLVEDDGRGFDVANTTGGAGLQSMRDRVDVVGGTLEIISRPDRGTTVRGRVQVSPDGQSNLDGSLDAQPAKLTPSSRATGPETRPESAEGPRRARGLGRPRVAGVPHRVRQRPAVTD